jgi:hypothetical protein
MPNAPASADPRLRARVTACIPLHYDAGPDPALDRPAHVRAGSALARLGGKLVVIQDDANFIAVVDVATGGVRALPLPAGPDGGRQFHTGRGNKHLKLDLEACVTIPGADGEILLAFGSGSSPLREQVAVVRGPHARAATLHPLPAFYAGLRAETAFSGSEMNVEAAAWVDGRIRLFNRGNGAPGGGLHPVNATCEIDAEAFAAHLHDPEGTRVPPPRGVTRYALGGLDGVPLGFTAASGSGSGRVLVAMAAEDSPDAVEDGPVAGTLLGVMEADRSLRWCVLEDAEGLPLREKIEGVLPGDAPGTLYAVGDPDDPDRPCDLLTVALEGPWDRGAWG